MQGLVSTSAFIGPASGTRSNWPCLPALAPRAEGVRRGICHERGRLKRGPSCGCKAGHLLFWREPLQERASSGPSGWGSCHPELSLRSKLQAKDLGPSSRRRFASHAPQDDKTAPPTVRRGPPEFPGIRRPARSPAGTSSRRDRTPDRRGPCSLGRLLRKRTESGEDICRKAGILPSSGGSACGRASSGPFRRRSAAPSYGGRRGPPEFGDMAPTRLPAGVSSALWAGRRASERLAHTARARCRHATRGTNHESGYVK